MPDGGRFALDIFKRDHTEEKKRLREILKALDQRQMWVQDWLPSNLENIGIYGFGKQEYKALLRSSIGSRRREILRMASDFDESVAQPAMTTAGIEQAILADVFKEETGSRLGTISYDRLIRQNEHLGETAGRIFASGSFSALLEIHRIKPDDLEIRKVTTAILHLAFGAAGSDLVADLNDNLFKEAPEDIPLLDDLRGLFTIDLEQIGESGLDIVLAPVPAGYEDDDTEGLFYRFGRACLEAMLTKSLSYEALIDSHFRYLYKPKNEWAKFCKMYVFLHGVRAYIQEQAEGAADRTGYYDDLLDLPAGAALGCIGTANYTLILDHKLSGAEVPIIHLNGSVEDAYDPRKNALMDWPTEGDDPPKRLLVPLLFTQSGIKPLTSTGMSRRYVDFVDSLKGCDAVVVVGFGFNADDGHINGLLREAVEDHGKPLIVVRGTAGDPPQVQQKAIARNIRLDEAKNVSVIQVDENREANGQPWLQAVLEAVQDNTDGENL